MVIEPEAQPNVRRWIWTSLLAVAWVVGVGALSSDDTPAEQPTQVEVRAR